MQLSRPVALPNTNAILHDLYTLLANGEPLVDFTKLRVLKEADKQNTLDRLHTIKAYVYTLSKEKDLAKFHAIEGLKYTEDPATISSCLSIFQLNGMPKTSIDQVRQHQNFLDDPNYIGSFSAFFACYPDVLLMERIMTRLEKMNLVENPEFKTLYDYFSCITERINYAATVLDLDKSACSRIIEVASELLEEWGVVLNSTRLQFLPESDWLSIILNVESNDPKQVAMMNWELVDRLIDHKLNDIPAVARFDVIEKEENIASVRYGNKS